MSPLETVQAQSSTGRRTFDVALVLFVFAVMALLGLGAGGVL